MQYKQHRGLKAGLAAAIGLAAIAIFGSPPAAHSTERADGHDPSRLAAGFATLRTTCFSCHSPDAAAGSPIAPSVAVIKRHYSADNASFETFRDALIAFVEDPRADNARVPQAVERFGLMPRMSFSAGALADAAYYLYHTPVENPAWFSASYADDEATLARRAPVALRTLDDYRDHGQQLAMQTKTVLGSAMKRSLKADGPQATVGFCRSQAAPIAARMSDTLGATIQRVSDRPRNPDNAADAQALEVMHAFREQLAQGGQPIPAVRRAGQHTVGYYPIVTNGMCLQCHGRPGTDITDATLAAIDANYPDDRARGYGSNELRGVFVVTMKSTTEQPR